MMRIRMLHPEFFTDEKMAALSDLARLVFTGLWLMADREGRLVDNVKTIDGLILPHDEHRSCREPLAELAAAGRIVRYASSQGRLIQVVNFTKWQHLHPKERPSKLPGPTAEDRLCFIPGSARKASGLDREISGKVREISGLDPSASTSTSTSTSGRRQAAPGRARAEAGPNGGVHQEQRRRVAPDARHEGGASAPVDAALVKKHFG